MHRQSLGSPAAKLHANGVIIVKESSPSPSSSLSLSLSSELQKKLPNHDEGEDDDDEMSPKKSHHKTTPPSRHHEKLIHLIPVLTLLCLLVLYLFSHNPSQNDLAEFNGFKTLSKVSDSRMKMEEMNGVLEIGKGDILAIRRARNLQGLLNRERSKSRKNRKIGDFSGAH